MIKVKSNIGTIKTKEFILRSNYYSDIKIDDMINDFLEENYMIDIVDIKYTNGSLSGTSEFYVRALLIYRELEVTVLSESEYNDEFGIKEVI